MLWAAFLSRLRIRRGEQLCPLYRRAARVQDFLAAKHPVQVDADKEDGLSSGQLCSASADVGEGVVTDRLVRSAAKWCGEQDPVFEDTNLHLLRVLSTASEVLSFMQQFTEAAGYAQRMVDGYTKLYHPNNAQLGMATMRAGVTHWHAGLIEAAHGLICRAYGILMITHGPHHPITKDLEVKHPLLHNHHQ
ncbi:hypothetical protein QQF64_009000 [Cirrhinus molitorella]|uniref:Uncharacterized protein n=1 Tax=Cirrhinus molitorella TaxID=172907 RepID=A0ABR3M7R0_9TELE